MRITSLAARLYSLTFLDPLYTTVVVIRPGLAFSSASAVIGVLVVSGVAVGSAVGSGVSVGSGVGSGVSAGSGSSVASAAEGEAIGAINHHVLSAVASFQDDVHQCNHVGNVDFSITVDITKIEKRIKKLIN